MPERIEGDRITITGRSAACFFPRTERETSFIREFDGRTPDGSFQLLGSIYGRQLKFTGSGDCHGLVVGRGDLSLDASLEGERQRFFGSVSANGAVTASAPKLPIRRSVIGGVEAASFLIRGDVVGDLVHLSNAIVVGNVHGTNIRLTNCIVFGAAIASESLTVQASTILYYHSRRATFEGPCMMLHAMGESGAPPVFAPYEDHDGSVLPCDIRYYPVVRSQEEKSLGNRTWSRPAQATLSRLIPGVDWSTVHTETDRVGSHGLPVRAERTVLSIASRALNLTSLQLAASQMSTMLKISFEFDHYSERVQNEALDRLRALATDEEYWVFSSLLQRPTD
jgi:hypothetical protein